MKAARASGIAGLLSASRTQLLLEERVYLFPYSLATESPFYNQYAFELTYFIRSSYMSTPYQMLML